MQLKLGLPIRQGMSPIPGRPAKKKTGSLFAESSFGVKVFPLSDRSSGGI
jgi:hypothetical protein